MELLLELSFLLVIVMMEIIYLGMGVVIVWFSHYGNVRYCINIYLQYVHINVEMVYFNLNLDNNVMMQIKEMEMAVLQIVLLFQAINANYYQVIQMLVHVHMNIDNAVMEDYWQIDLNIDHSLKILK
jgi:hypothetical protein